MAIYNKENVKKYDGLYESGHDHDYPNLDLVRLAAKYFIDKNTNLLDFGFGSGENLFHFHRKNFKVYGIEASIKAIELVEKKIKQKDIKDNKIKLKKINENDKKIPFEDNFFDNIICTSVISILKSKENILELIQEFHRILKKNGKLIIDINGPKSSFQKEGKFISEDIYETNIKGGGKIKVYCPQNKKVFSNLFQDFHVDELGEVKFNYFNFSEHEYIACVRKKN